MQTIQCPTCGRDTTSASAGVCSHCGRAVTNGTANGSRHPAQEAANLPVEAVPPEIREHFLRTFDETEYWAALRAAENAANQDIDDLLAELERKVHDQS